MTAFRHIAAAFFLAILHAQAQTSNLQTVRGWTRTHVLGLPGGNLRDPTGTIAPAVRLAAAAAAADESSLLVEAAGQGLTNALARLAAETNHVADFTGRIYLAADLDADPGYANIQGTVVSESVDPDGTIHYYCHYNYELAAPPRTIWSFESAPGSILYAPGFADTNNATTNVLGLACYDIRVTRPAGSGNGILRPHKFMKTGAPGYPFDVPDAGIAIVRGGITNVAFTGSVSITNAALSNVVVEAYLSGALYTVTTNAIGGN